MVFRKSAIELAVPAKHKFKCEHQPEALPKRQFQNIMVYFSQWPIAKAEKSRSGICFGKKYPRKKWAATKKSSN